MNGPPHKYLIPSKHFFLSRELFLVEVEQQENPILYGSSESAETKTEGRKELLAMGFKHLKSALHALNFSADEVKGIFNVVAACLHLGLAGYQSGENNTLDAAGIF